MIPHPGDGGLPGPPTVSGVVVLTDRRLARRPLVDVVAAAVAGGVRWVVLREKDLPRAERSALAAELRPILAEAGGTLIVAGPDPLLGTEHADLFGAVEHLRGHPRPDRPAPPAAGDVASPPGGVRSALGGVRPALGGVRSALGGVRPAPGRVLPAPFALLQPTHRFPTESIASVEAEQRGRGDEAEQRGEGEGGVGRGTGIAGGGGRAGVVPVPVPVPVPEQEPGPVGRVVVALHLAAADPGRTSGADLVGRSCHDETELRRLRTEDYAFLSPVYPTSTKPGYGPPLGTAGLAALIRLSPVPVLALGGIETPAQVRACVRAGAVGVAVLGAVMRSPDPRQTAAELTSAFAAAIGQPRGLTIEEDR